MYDSAEAEVVSVCMEIHPSGLQGTCHSAATGELLWSRHPALPDMRTVSCKMTTTCTAA